MTFKDSVKRVLHWVRSQWNRPHRLGQERLQTHFQQWWQSRLMILDLVAVAGWESLGVPCQWLRCMVEVQEQWLKQ